MWMRAFYGFSPDEAGYVGWTDEAGQRRALRDLSDGDLILIYGASSSATKKAARGHVIGFVEIEARAIRDYEKSSPAYLTDKAQGPHKNKWTYGLPIRRAWIAHDKMPIAFIANETYRKKAAQAIGVWGMPMAPAEIAKALKIKVTEVSVYGEPPVASSALKKQAFAQEFSPSRAFPGSFGTHMVTKNDGVTFLYLARFEGDGQALLGKPATFGSKSVALKIGVSSDPGARIGQLNAGIPPAAQGRWQPHMQAEYPDRKSAENVEQAFKDRSFGKLDSLGGEFFWGASLDAEILFCSLPGVARFGRDR